MESGTALPRGRSLRGGSVSRKEECLYLHDFETLEEARQMIAAFVERYNREWLLERHGHRTPVDLRQQHLQAA